MHPYKFSDCSITQLRDFITDLKRFVNKDIQMNKKLNKYINILMVHVIQVNKVFCRNTPKLHAENQMFLCNYNYTKKMICFEVEELSAYIVYTHCFHSAYP